ncbi:hypothetical protein INT47_005032 [Mucor saturninus]|uniref:C2 domain-containing protein n=1 Tax=Mucor saturninus TaxID=64648 RepID=A0A8H7QJR7_9FUNG|nr:hypothetical protein INT47_005032 [Mucor saturninus]
MSHPPHVIGELVVVALKAEKLQHQAPAKQDPFCLFRIGDIAKRTKIDHGGGLYPIWDDQVNLPVTAGYHQMHVQIFDKDTMPNNLMGEGIVDLSKVLREKEHDGYFPLHYRGKQNCGDIYLELTFYSAQNTAVRPQQQVRYPAGQPYPYAGPPLQHRPPPPQQHRPPPPQQQQHRPPPPPQQQQLQHHQQQQYHPPVHHQHRPLPQRPLPPPQHMSQHQMHRPPPQQQQQQQQLQSRPSMVGPPPSHHRPSMGGPPPPPPSQHSRPPPHFPQPSSSMGTQHFSPAMPSPQPLLSAAYNPAPTPRPPPPPPGNYSPYPNTGFNEQRPMYSHPPARPNYNPRPYPPY